MIERKYKRIPLGNIVPEGYMKRQLEVQASGLTGNIRFIWDDLSDNSAWLGGDGEAWERGPYYLDGLIPLSFLLDNDTLKAEVLKWINSIIERQQPSGFFGPAWNNDWWPRMVVLKAFVTYYDLTKDERIITFLDKYLEYQYKKLDEYPLEMWASARALEVMEAIELVYEKTGKEYLPLLIRKLKEYMYDWFECFGDFPYKKTAGHYISKTLFKIVKEIYIQIEEATKKNHKIKTPKSAKKILRYNNSRLVKDKTMLHGVNIAMALKYPVTYGMMEDREDLYALSHRGYESLMKYHGTANGLWTCDEHLCGPNPANGVELCTVVELMYSMEEMLSITGNHTYADILELLAYNTFPATLTPDMCAHQYVQQVNQIAADKKKRQFFDAGKEANLYGLAPYYGCCAANMHQGFPKFTANLCHRSSEGLAFLIYAPCTVNVEMSPGEKIVIKETTDYPFGNRISFEIIETNASDLLLSFRIPGMTEGEIFYNGKSEGKHAPGIVSLAKNYKKGDRLEIVLDMPLRKVTNPDNSISFRMGSLLFALKISEEYTNFRGKEPFNYRQYRFKSDWNMAPVLKSGEPEVTEVIRNDIPDMPFDVQKPPIAIKMKGVRVENWKVYKNSAGPYPLNPRISDETMIELVPYGSTNIRVAQFPVVER